MPLPSRSATNTKTSEATRVDLEKGEGSQSASPIDEKKQQAEKAAEEIDDNPETAPQECTRQEALEGSYLYPFDAVLTALETDPEAGLHSGEVKKRQVSERGGDSERATPY